MSDASKNEMDKTEVGSLLNCSTGAQSQTNAVAASKNAALDRAISFIVATLFDQNSSKRELLLLRSLFLPIARITLVPRERPILATIIDLDELFRIRGNLFLGGGQWNETFRVHEDDSTGDSVRVMSNVASSAGTAMLPRTADILFSVKTVASDRWVIRSCNVVYDEATNAKSPVTLIS